MSVMNNFAIEAAAADVVHNPIVIRIEFAEGECEPSTVKVGNIEFTMAHVQNVSVRFNGRSCLHIDNVSGWIFRSTCGRYSDMLLNSNPTGYIHEGIAKMWMSKNTDTIAFKTTVTIK